MPEFRPSVNNAVNAIAVSPSAVYVGGNFTVAAGRERIRLAALRPRDGAIFTWAPRARGGQVWALTLSPDRSKLIVGGQFLHLNTPTGPRGLGAVSTTNSALVPWQAANQVKMGGKYSSISSLTTQGSSVVGTGWVSAADPAFRGNVEGAFRANGNTGTLEWVQDCHGDTYSSYATTRVVYTVGHAHDCANIGAFPQQDQKWHRMLAVSRAPAGIVRPVRPGYPDDWAGEPAPALLHFDPRVAVGNYTGQHQGAWSVTGSGDGAWVVIGGEFPRVNGRAQQGLARFAISSGAPNDVGPELGGAQIQPILHGINSNFLWARFPANYDPDNEALTYRVRRDDLATPLKEFSARSSFWHRPVLGFNDVSVVPGTTYRYRIETVDPFGNARAGDWVSITAPVDGGLVNAYAKGVLADGAAFFWRLDAGSGTLAHNFAGGGAAPVGTGVSWRARGAIVGSPNSGATFNGSSAGWLASPYRQVAPGRFSLEAWVKTTSTKGGLLVGFANTALGTSTTSDRHLYLRNDGRIAFGVGANGPEAVVSPQPYHDGTWHHVVATFDPAAGMHLYVDGARVGGRPGPLTPTSYLGFWRVGSGTLTGWPGAPTSRHLAAKLDEAAVYPTALTGAAVARHYQASGDTAAH